MKQGNYRGGGVATDLVQFSRELRRHTTEAEQRLWRRLRNRQVAGAKFRRQHAYGPYVLDFFCPERGIVVEVEGSQHFEARGIVHDEGRRRYLEGLGLKVLRFTNTEVLAQTDQVVDAIWRAVMGDEPMDEQAFVGNGEDP